MRVFFMAFFFVLMAFINQAGATSAVPDSASTICSIDAPVLGYELCPKTLHNDDIRLNTPGYNGARLEPTITLSRTPIWAHGICKYVDAKNLSAAIFIPFNTQEEWQRFLDNAAGVSKTNCCVPRNLVVGDVPVPTETCVSGTWKFEGLVNESNYNQTIAVPLAQGVDAEIRLVSGVAEDKYYPIQSLPMDRDDANSTLPNGVRVTENYVAKFTCAFGRQPVGLNAQPAAVIGNVKYIKFRLQCRDANWRPVDPTSCVPEQVGETFTQACGLDQDGVVTKRRVRTCPTGDVVEEFVSSTCTCIPSRTETVTRNCPDGQEGSITVKQTRVCFGRQPVSIDASAAVCTCDSKEEVISNTCKPACHPGEVDTFTENCPAGQVGLITKRHVRVCPSGDITTQLVSNTCKVPCTPTDSSVTQTCPAGYQGSITVRTQHLCDGSNNGFGRDVVTTNNQCILPPSPPTSSGGGGGDGGC